MKQDEITIDLNCNYSLFLLEKSVGGWGSELIEQCFLYVETYDTLEEVQLAQKEFKQKTIILASW